MTQIHTFYVPTFDHDEQFVREIVVGAVDDGDASKAAIAELCSGEMGVGQPQKLRF